MRARLLTGAGGVLRLITGGALLLRRIPVPPATTFAIEREQRVFKVKGAQ